MRPICIVEPILGGHHGWYLQWIVEGLDPSNVQLLTTPAALEHPALRRLTASHPSLEVRPSIKNRAHLGGASRLRASQNRWIDSLSLITAVKENGLPGRFHFFPFIDPIAYEIGLLPNMLRGASWSAIFMSPSFHQERARSPQESVKAHVQARLFGRLLCATGLSKLFVLDPTLIEYATRRWRASAEKLAYLRDPIPPPMLIARAEARKTLGLAETDCMVLAYGSLTRRKGILSLLNALCSPNWNPAVKVVLAGNPDQEITRRVDTYDCQRAVASGRLMLKTYYLSEDEEATVFCGADYCWLGYSHFYQMSGVLVKAMAYGVPVIATSSGVIGTFVKKEGSGLFLNSLEPSAIAAQIGQLPLEKPFPFRSRHGLRERAKDFYVATASAPVTEHIRECTAKL